MFVAKKSRRDFVPRTFALTAPLHPVLHRVSSSYEKIPNAPEHYEMHQNMIYGPMGWIRYFGCEKLQRDFVARTFALIAPVLSVLQQVSCSYETIPNAPKYYETHQNISLGCNGEIRCIRCEKSGVNSRHELLH